MITFRKLGSLGRLGNQMFQYASLRGIAEKNNENWSIPVKGTGITDYCLLDCFELKSAKFIENYNLPTKKSRWFHFDENMLNKTKNCNLEDFLQTEKYFLHIKSKILEDFTFKKEIIERIKHILNKIDNNTAFLHIRRGDNVGHPFLVNDPSENLSYYSKALTHFDKNIKFLVVSDEIEWCKNQTFFQDSRFIFSEEWEKFDSECWLASGNAKSTVPFYDLCLMSFCNGAIIPTSTFGWWGAYLQKNRTNNIVTQFPWFGPELEKKSNSKDIVPNSWLKLNWNGELIK